jgi:hypothetical protein
VSDGEDNRMKFVVSRTSQYGDDSRPCPEATGELQPRWDVRTFKSPEEHDAKVGHLRSGTWASRGTEHQTVYGPRGGVAGIKRHLGDETVWSVEIPDLDALLSFAEQHGELVLTPWNPDDRMPALEIYDTYRE